MHSTKIKNFVLIVCSTVFILTFTQTLKAAAVSTKQAQPTTSSSTQSGPNEINSKNGDSAAYNNDNAYHANAAIDPFEKLNRKIFAFNRIVDKIIIRPIAKVYDTIVPGFIQKRIGNFFRNLDEIPNVANDILQANPVQAMSDMWRFITNSTIGIGGLFDVASRLGLERNQNDLALTFAKWGAKEAPYIVLPFWGPATIRDTIGLFANYQFLSVWPWIHPDKDRYILLGTDFIDLRSDLLSGDKVIDQAFDPYVFVRDAYLQHRTHMLNKVKNIKDNDQSADSNQSNGSEQKSVKIPAKPEKS